MKLVPIFDLKRSSTQQLFAVRYSPDGSEALMEFFENLNDAEWLRKFCLENKADVNRNFNGNIHDAMKQILREAYDLEEMLLSYENPFETDSNLGELFQPLHNHEAGLYTLQLSKASYKSGPNKHAKLRLYAIRINKNVFVITGGAIKLTQKMQDRSHTQIELDKLYKVKDWLKDNGISFPEDLNELL